MKNNSTSSPFHAAQNMDYRFPLTFAVMLLGIIIMFLPEEVKIIIAGIVFLIGSALTASILQEKFNASKKHEEKSVNGMVTLPFRDVIAKKRSESLRQKIAA